MRARRENRREKYRIRPTPKRGDGLAPAMRRSGLQRGMPAFAALMDILAPAPSGDDQNQSPLSRHSINAPNQLGTIRHAIMTQDHPGPARQPIERRPERLAHTRIGHQPNAGNRGVAGSHRPSYSRAMLPDEASERIDAVRQSIARAAKIAGRESADITLVAISKTHDADAIRPLIAAGQRVFGENRVQEAAAKWPELRETTPDLELHLVGQLQSNKAEEAVALFDAIHSLDRPSLADALAKAMEKLGNAPTLFVQVNIGAEDQKGGCTIADLPGLLAHAKSLGLDVAGLMCVPPLGIEPAPYFALLAKLARDNGLTGLSMGMSSDYVTAVTLGATHVRVGTALFGGRG